MFSQDAGGKLKFKRFKSGMSFQIGVIILGAYWWMGERDRTFQFTDTKSALITNFFTLSFCISDSFLIVRCRCWSIWIFTNSPLKKWWQLPQGLKRWHVLLSILCLASHLNLSSSPCNQRRSVSEISKCRPGQETQLHISGTLDSQDSISQKNQQVHAKKTCDCVS